MAPIAALVLLVTALGQEPQPAYTQYGETTERGGTRIAYWDNGKNRAIGQASIQFGRPVWKAEYDGQLDAMTSGKIWRLGDNFWTSLDTNIPLIIGGVDVPVGYYYLVVKRTADGSRWSLAFLDPAAIRRTTFDAYEVITRPADVVVDFEAPLTFESRDSVQDRLTIDLTEERLVIQWGNFALSAPVKAAAPSN